MIIDSAAGTGFEYLNPGDSGLSNSGDERKGWSIRGVYGLGAPELEISGSLPKVRYDMVISVNIPGVLNNGGVTKVLVTECRFERVQKHVSSSLTCRTMNSR